MVGRRKPGRREDSPTSIKLGSEGIVSKLRDRPHQPGRTSDWLKTLVVEVEFLEWRSDGRPRAHEDLEPALAALIAEAAEGGPR